MGTCIHWFRRDLRVRDNTGLIAAARSAGRDGHVVGVFVIDDRWWPAQQEQLGAFQARFWLDSLAELQRALADRGITLVIRRGADPVAELLDVAETVRADAIFWNRDYEPAQRALDARLERAAAERGLETCSCKDAVQFEEREILTGQGEAYSVFTPYRRSYLKALHASPPQPLGLPPKTAPGPRVAAGRLPTLGSLGFAGAELDIQPGERAGHRRLEAFTESSLATYAKTRDTPALRDGTSRLSAHLNAGTLSIRQVLAAALTHPTAGETFVSELIWRDFSRMILAHHPETVTEPFQKRYAAVTWSNDERLIAAWQEGRTGYPIVDAAMAQLNQTGFMHNRLRMITAMFLTKDLDVHWAIGERYFRRTLMDYDQAANVGGWQWSASTGTDAAPYFRVMNPTVQSKRWDPRGEFIRRYVPGLADVPDAGVHQPRDPIVDHAAARERAIAKFSRALPR